MYTLGLNLNCGGKMYILVLNLYGGDCTVYTLGLNLNCGRMYTLVLNLYGGRRLYSVQSRIKSQLWGKMYNLVLNLYGWGDCTVYTLGLNLNCGGGCTL